MDSTSKKVYLFSYKAIILWVILMYGCTVVFKILIMNIHFRRRQTIISDIQHKHLDAVLRKYSG